MANIRYYKIPLPFAGFLKRKDLPQCALSESIAQNLFVIITTKFGECRYDYTYGCEIWESDFEQITNESIWAEKIARAITLVIRKHEKRLNNIQVEVNIKQEEKFDHTKFQYRIKKKLEIKVTGSLTLTNEKFNFFQDLYISPLSFD